MATNRIYCATGLIGNGTGDLDSIKGSGLIDKDMAFAIDQTTVYVYALDADSGAVQSSPNVIKPNDETGDKRWILQSLRVNDITVSDDIILVTDDLNVGGDLTADTLTSYTTDTNLTLAANGTGVIDINDSWNAAGQTCSDLGIVTTADINGGSIDGATIGAASASTIVGTTINASTSFTRGGTVITDNTITDDGTLSIVTATGTIITDSGTPGSNANLTVGTTDSLRAGVYLKANNSTAGPKINWEVPPNNDDDSTTSFYMQVTDNTDDLTIGADNDLDMLQWLGGTTPSLKANCALDVDAALTATTVDADEDFTVGNTKITSGQLEITNSGGTFTIAGTSETMATFVDDGAVTLYNNNVAEFYTVSNGGQFPNGLVSVGTDDNTSGTVRVYGAGTQSSSAEDLTTYTESDPNSDLTVTSTSVAFDTVMRTAEGYVVYDFGASYFDDWEVQLDFVVSAVTGQTACAFGAFSNTLGDMADIMAADDGYTCNFYWPGAGSCEVIIEDFDNNTNDKYYPGGSTFSRLYATWKKVSTAITCELYSDSGRTTLVDTLSIVCTETLKRYFYAFNSRGFGAGAGACTGDSSNHTFMIAGPTGGAINLYTTTDHDATIDSYNIAVNEDDLLIGPGTDTDSLKYTGADNKWNFTGAAGVVIGSTAYTDATITDDGTLDIVPTTAMHVKGGSNVYVGTDNTTRGRLDLYGPSGDTTGGQLLIYNSAANDDTEDYYIMQTTSDEAFNIGSASNVDMLKFLIGGTIQSTVAFDVDAACTATTFDADLDFTVGGLIITSNTLTGDAVITFPGSSGIAVGANESVEGYAALYGAAASTGGTLTIYTAADSDDNVDVYQIAASGENLNIGPDNDADLFQIIGAATPTAKFNAAVDVDAALTATTVGADTSVAVGAMTMITNKLSNTGSFGLYVNGTEGAAYFAANGAVTLYYDNNAKFATTATGIETAGTIGVSTADTNLTLAANGTGVIDINDSWNAASQTCSDLGTVTTADINGGTIDGATIGASSATTIKGTTINATTDVTLEDDAKMVLTHPSADGKACGIILQGETVDTNAAGYGGIVYLNSDDGHWDTADKDTEGAGPDNLIGVALGTTGSVDVLLYGLVQEDDWGWTIGDQLFLNDDGDMTHTASTTSGDFVRVMGHAYDADTMFFNPSADYYEVA
jgi:hypothetical protein